MIDTEAANYTTDGSYSQPAAIGQPLTVTDNLGKTAHFRYDSRGNPQAATDALGNETDFTYNIADQPLQTTLPATGQQGSGHASSVSAYLYAGGPMTGVTAFDESGAAIRQVSYAYGQEGETLGVSGSTEPVTYTYDGQYRLATLTDGGGHTTRYYYKQQGYLDAVTYPGYTGPAPVYNSATDDYDTIAGKDSLRYPTYDANGNLLKRVDGNNVTTTYTYSDPESLLTNIAYAYPSGYTGGTTGDVSLTYDQYGRRASMTDGVGSQAYAYDDNNDLLSNTTTYTGLPAQAISYGYYPSGSRQSMNTPAGGFSYSYDAVGRMTGLTNPFSITSSWQYLDNGWLSQKLLRNGGSLATASAYSEDARGEVVSNSNHSGASYQNQNATFDGVGNVINSAVERDGNPSGFNGTTAYTYDYGQTASPALNRSQLTQEQFTPESLAELQGNSNPSGGTYTQGSGYTNVFSYDGGTSVGPGNPTTWRGVSRAFNAGNQDTASTYDGNGNCLGYGSYDPEGRLIQGGTPQNSLMAGYTGDGLRAWKQNSAGARTYFLYDGQQPVCELGSTGVVTATNTFGADGLLSRQTTGGSVLYWFDLSGNVTERRDASGSLLSTHKYDAFGQRQSRNPDVFGFGGQWGCYTDAETGLVLMTHRYYDPNAGRFLTRDPIGYAGGINLYAYTGNNPVNRADPKGLQAGYNTGYDPTTAGPITPIAPVNSDPDNADAPGDTAGRDGPAGFCPPATGNPGYAPGRTGGGYDGTIPPYYDPKDPDHGEAPKMPGTEEKGQPELPEDPSKDHPTHPGDNPPSTTLTGVISGLVNGVYSTYGQSPPRE